MRSRRRHLFSCEWNTPRRAAPRTEPTDAVTCEPGLDGEDPGGLDQKVLEAVQEVEALLNFF